MILTAFSFGRAVSKPSKAVFHLWHRSSSSNVAAPLLPGRCWSHFWPGLFPTAGARAGQAGTLTTDYSNMLSSSYPCLAPPVLSCHIQSLSLIFVLNLQLSHCDSLSDLWTRSCFSTFHIDECVMLWWCDVTCMLCDPIICELRAASSG